MPDPFKIDPEKKIWLPESTNNEKRFGGLTEQKFRGELHKICQAHKIGTLVCIYVNYEEPTKGKIMVIGQPSAKWLDACWMRLRLFASDLITRGKVK